MTAATPEEQGATRLPGADRPAGRVTDRVARWHRGRRARRLVDAAPRPAGADAPIDIAGRAPLRVLLFGTGAPATGAGVTTRAEALGARIASELAASTGRGVRCDSLIAEDWLPPDPVRALQQQGLDRYDVIVVISTYRPSLTHVPVDRWLDHVVEVRDVICSAKAPEALIQILSLPWRDAATAVPATWGGALGARIRTLDNLASASLQPDAHVLRLKLSAPGAGSEWVGPAFSAATYRAWGAEAAAQLAAHLPQAVAAR